MTMSVNNRISYTAFVCALLQLDSALRNEIQPQIDSAKKEILMDKIKVSILLDDIAVSCPTLGKIYQNNCSLIENAIAKDKRLDPKPLTCELTAETSNTMDLDLHDLSDLDYSDTDPSGDTFIIRVMGSIKSLVDIDTDAVKNLSKKLTNPDKADV